MPSADPHRRRAEELRAEGRTVNRDGRRQNGKLSLRKGAVRLRPPFPLRLRQG
jgi:hypothetical protein